MRTLRFLAVLVPIFVCHLQGDDVERIVQEGRVAEEQLDPQRALIAYRQADLLRPQDPFILQKIARQLSDLMYNEPDRAERRRLAEEGLTYAQRALDLAPHSAENAISVAILYGKLGLQASVSERVEYARLAHRYADQALALDPDYAWAHHVMGEWHMNVAALGATKRILARMIFGSLPAASRETGLRHLQRAVELEPEAIAHRVSLGLALNNSGRREDASFHLNYAAALPNRTIYDPAAKARARAALTADS